MYEGFVLCLCWTEWLKRCDLLSSVCSGVAVMVYSILELKKLVFHILNTYNFIIIWNKLKLRKKNKMANSCLKTKMQGSYNFCFMLKMFPLPTTAKMNLEAHLIHFISQVQNVWSLPSNDKHENAWSFTSMPRCLDASTTLYLKRFLP